jgi:hypothetical protein
MTMTKLSFYCFEELIEYVNNKNYSITFATKVINDAVVNYSLTNKWFIEVMEKDPFVYIKNFVLCSN